MKSLNPIVANAMAARNAVVKNALSVEDQRKNDVDWNKFSTEAGKTLADGEVIKKELKAAETALAACYAKIKPVFDKAVNFGHDKKQFCFSGRPFATKNLMEDDRYERRISETISRLKKEVMDAILSQADIVRNKAYDIVNLNRPFFD